MKLGPKITLGYVVSAFLVVILGAINYESAERVEQQHEAVVKTVIPNLQALQKLEASGLRMVGITSELIWMHAHGLDVASPENWANELAEMQLSAIDPYEEAIARYRMISEKGAQHEIVFVNTIEGWGSQLKEKSWQLVELETSDASLEELEKLREELEKVEQGYLLSIHGAMAHENQDLVLGTEDLEKALDDDKNRVVVGSSMAFGVAILLGILLARSLARPIIALKDAAVALGRGKLDTRVDIHSRDEVGTLAESFNSMGDALGKAAVVFENTIEGVVIADDAANIVGVNKAFTDITGYEESEVMGQNVRMLKSERHDRMHFANMWSQMMETGQWRGEIWNRRKNGELYPVWESVRAIHDDKGEISHFVSVFSDISSIKQSQEKLDYLAYHDPLTNLPNRLLFEDRLEQALKHARREKHQVALLFLDLDRFKNINDSLGHPIGDTLLVVVAQRLIQLLRDDDTVARIGGDEFVIVIENVAKVSEVAMLAQKLIDAFNTPLNVEEREMHVTLSIGISMFPGDGDDVPTLLKNADAALYRAKEEGRNGFQFYTSELTSNVFERLALETALRSALKDERMIVYYQPMVSFRTGDVIAAEALLRWDHPELGIVGPDKFISLAEDTGLIISIGEWVLHEACRQAREWLDSGYEFERVSVNVSGVQIQRGNFDEVVIGALKASGLQGRYLELELTENVIMQKTEKVIEVLGKLKKAGVQIAIDDFGTGYSSLSYLKQLPVDKLKIDKSFVRDISIDANDEAIACAVNALAKTLNLMVVAEGVETAAQETFLKQMGCDVGQGYFYSRPVIPTEVVSMFKRRSA
jgi:diguanylate cyclase (GGDEF)-like protein/PAS domain S-box-containing protein